MAQVAPEKPTYSRLLIPVVPPTVGGEMLLLRQTARDWLDATIVKSD